jgi:aspartyl-tRNA synthetase
VAATEIEVLAESDPLPFPIDGSAGAGGGELNEEVRLRYRYLDIRRAEMAAALRARSTAAYLVSEVMRVHRFRERGDPVPDQVHAGGRARLPGAGPAAAGHWYALPQSPQLFKQLLMVSGLERYYQLVRCFRDEDFRADRQPEFTQIDIEMSFVTREDVVEVAEDLVARLWSRSPASRCSGRSRR